MKNKACIILGDSFTFPEGDAATNRVYTYAKGLAENGVSVHVVCFRNDYVSYHSGETEGIKYHLPFRQSQRSPYFIVRRINNLAKYYNTITLFRQIQKEQRIENVVAYTIRKNTQLFGFFLSRMFRSNLILERSEHPFKSYRTRIGEKVSGRFRVAFEIVFSDYIFCISSYLIDFYRRKGAREGKLFKVPSTVDVTRFNTPYERKVQYPYICYSGSLTRQKDGVDILIRSFSGIAPDYPEINLVLVGKADTMEDEVFFRELVTSMDLENRVLFTGKVSRNEIPSYICNAELLVLARPESIVADAGFPSKVSEYLSTGRPVVVTRVGEIPDYLTHNQSAFLAEPGSVNDFAANLRLALEDKDQAESVGLRGREIAQTVFSYKLQAARIMDFLEKK
jgi:glycosyltransferase involved in cell wall biosynthesis